MKTTRTLNLVKVAIAFTVSALMLAGCVSAAALTAADALKNASAQGDKSSTGSADELKKTNFISLSDAKSAVLAELGLEEAQFVDRDYDLDDGIYELEFTAGGVEYEYDVNAVTGEVVKVETERKDDRSESRATVEQPAESAAGSQAKETEKVETKPAEPKKTGSSKPRYIGLKAAKAAVLAELNLNEADFVDKEYDLDDGIYELEFTANGIEYDCDVNAVTGAIVKIEKEKDDDRRATPTAETKPAEPKKTGSSKPRYIGLEAAKAAVLAELNLNEADFVDKEYDLDDGIYELEFTANGIEYDCDVNAVTGAIVKIEKEKDDDRRVTPTTETKKTVTKPAETKTTEIKPAESKPAYIGLEAAKKKVFGQLGLTEADVRDAEYDLDDGVYEIEFKANGMEYEYAVNAVTGGIVKAEQDRDD